MNQDTAEYVFGVCNALGLRCNALQCYSNGVSKDHLAVYGSVSIPRAYCERCGGYAFVIDGLLQCCDSEYDVSPTGYQRMTRAAFIRKKPGPGLQKLILKSQDNHCFYCDQVFGSFVNVRHRFVLLEVRWDHLVPFAWQGDNRPDNFVAACKPCNTWKRSLMFDTVEEARRYLCEKWKEAQRDTD